jgi:hypothetical protein
MRSTVRVARGQRTDESPIESAYRPTVRATRAHAPVR